MATINSTTEKVVKQTSTMHYFAGMRALPEKNGKVANLFCIGKSYSEIDDNSPIKGFWVSKETLKANKGALGRAIVSEVNKILNEN